MARRKPTKKTHRRGGRDNSRSNNKIYVILGAILGCVAIGFIIWKLIDGPNEDYVFTREDLDKYVEYSQQPNLLGDGAGVYLDMSDGMNSAYSSQDSKLILQSIINKLAAEKSITFTGMSNGKLFPIELSHTALYNYVLSPSNYQKQQAPIEETLKTILEKKQPALLLSDFEEYKDGHIQKAAYAKRYFTDWLQEGYNIYFYKYGFTENGKSKFMFITVFDDNANRLNSLVKSAIQTSGTTIIEPYVLAGKEFSFPTSVGYASPLKGGNYHNDKGKDAVTNVQENGGPEDYRRYAEPVASSTGEGAYAPLQYNFGNFVEYYPIGETWENAIANAKNMQQSTVAPYTHLLSNLFIDFNAQSGYSIEDIEARCFNMMKTMEMVKESLPADQIINHENPEITLFLTADKVPAKEFRAGWEEIRVDFDENFTGKFTNSASNNLFRVNITISKVKAKIEEARSYFSWADNPSLAESVINTLTANSSNPTGRVLYTYYLKTLDY